MVLELPLLIKETRAQPHARQLPRAISCYYSTRPRLMRLRRPCSRTSCSALRLCFSQCFQLGAGAHLPPWYANGCSHSSMAFMSRIAGPVGERTDTALEGAAAPDGHFGRFMWPGCILICSAHAAQCLGTSTYIFCVRLAVPCKQKKTSKRKKQPGFAV